MFNYSNQIFILFLPCQTQNIFETLNFWLIVVTGLSILVMGFTSWLSTHTNKQISETETRPYLGILEFDAYRRTDNDTLSINIKYKNFGKTPARDIEAIFETISNKKILSSEQLPNYIFTLSPSEEEHDAPFSLQKKCTQSLFEEGSVFQISVKLHYLGVTGIKYCCQEQYEYSHIRKCFVRIKSRW